MKNSIDHSGDTAAIKNQPCSEKTCVTCFENRGCMYEQYLIAGTYNIEEFYPGNIISNAAQQNQESQP